MQTRLPIVAFGHGDRIPFAPAPGETLGDFILVARTGGEPDFVTTDGCQFRPDGAADAFVDFDRATVLDAKAFYAFVARDVANSVAGDDVRRYARGRMGRGLVTHHVRATRYALSFDRTVMTAALMKGDKACDRPVKGGMRRPLRTERYEIMAIDRTSTTPAYDRARLAGVGTPVLTAIIDGATFVASGTPGCFSVDALAELVALVIAEAGHDRRMESLDFDVAAS